MNFIGLLFTRWHADRDELFLKLTHRCMGKAIPPGTEIFFETLASVFAGDDFRDSR